MPGFQTKPLTITIVSGNDSRIFPRNVMACFTHVLSQSWFWAVKIRNSPLMFFQTCAKLAFCLTQIYFLAITAWYRVYSMCFLIGRNAILGFRKNMSQCLKGFQGNLDTTIFKLELFWLIPQFLECSQCPQFPKVLQQSRTFKELRNQSGEFLKIVVSRLPWNPLRHWDIFLRNPRIAFRLIRKHMLYTLYHAVIARKYIWVKQNASFAHVRKNIKGLFLILTTQNQLWLSTCVKQDTTLGGKILESLPLAIVMVNGFVWKPGISKRALVP